MNRIHIDKLLEFLQTPYDELDVPFRRNKVLRALHYHQQGWQLIPDMQRAELLQALKEMKDVEEASDKSEEDLDYPS